MRIKILGNGGAINDGLPYNSFIINDDLLVEAPPDIMNSVFREKINLKEIRAIYISHFHADHYFGLPFLFLRKFVEGAQYRVEVIGPLGIEEKVQEVCSIAFGPDHPMMGWIREHVGYTGIEGTQEILIDDRYKLKPIEMFHFTQTFGFVLEYDRKKVAYLADTYWQDIFLESIEGVDTIIVDLNGEKNDKTKVHISEDDLIKHALLKLKYNVNFYGTHLREDKASSNKRIQYLKCGDEIRI